MKLIELSGKQTFYHIVQENRPDDGVTHLHGAIFLKVPKRVDNMKASWAKSKALCESEGYNDKHTLVIKPMNTLKWMDYLVKDQNAESWFGFSVVPGISSRLPPNLNLLDCFLNRAPAAPKAANPGDDRWISQYTSELGQIPATIDSFTRWVYKHMYVHNDFKHVVGVSKKNLRDKIENIVRTMNEDDSLPSAKKPKNFHWGMCESQGCKNEVRHVTGAHYCSPCFKNEKLYEDHPYRVEEPTLGIVCPQPLRPGEIGCDWKGNPLPTPAEMLSEFQ